MGEPGEPGQKGRQVSTLHTPSRRPPLPTAEVTSTALCSCTGRSRHRRPHWIPRTQGKLLRTLPRGRDTWGQAKGSLAPGGAGRWGQDVSGVAHRSHPCPKEGRRFCISSDVPGGTSAPEPDDHHPTPIPPPPRPSFLPQACWVPAHTLVTLLFFPSDLRVFLVSKERR